MKARISLAAALLGLSAAAAPSVSGIALTQADDRTVTVSYTLAGGPAIVTYDILTNGVSVGGQALWRSWGDVNAKVASGARTIRWQPREWNDRFVVDGSVSAKVTAWPLDNPPDYMAVDLGMPSNRLWYADAESVPLGVTNILYKTEKLLMRRIHAAGIVWRKDSAQGEETGHLATEILRPVMLTEDYYMGVFQVTYRQHAMINNPAVGKTDYPEWPQQKICINDLRGAAPDIDWPTTGSAVASDSVIGKLRKYTGVMTFDLPTDAQWDFACMGGDTHARFGVSSADLPQYAWYADSNYTDGRFGPYTDNPLTGAGIDTRRFQRVGLLKPNPFGLYDILGNGSELCQDWYAEGDDYAKLGVLQIDPKGPMTGTDRIVHAASVNHDASCQRAGDHRPGMVMSPAGASSWVYATYRLICGISAESDE